MNLNNGSFLIVSMNKKAAFFLRNILNEVFEYKIMIHAYSFLDDEEKILTELIEDSPNLIAATGEESYQNILKYYDHDKILFASRNISEPEYFDKLFLIPKGKKVLVVNETESGCKETIESIINLGITHLTYIPYWQDCNTNIEGIDTAISPGMLYYCPKSIPNKINIGMRNVSVDTFLKIIEAFDLDINYLDIYLQRQKRLLIDTYKSLSIEYTRSNNLRESLETIINEFDEALISINSHNRITILNSTAERLLNLTSESLFNKKISSLFENKNEIDFSDLNNINNIVTINHKQVYVTYIPLNDTETNIGIFKLREVSSIQENDEEVRKLIYQKNKNHMTKYTFDSIISCSSEMDNIINDAKFFSKSNSTILITGESGTGKELFAQSIHNHSDRARNPFVAANFAALPENLIESELFGYEEGAFTGAKKSGKKGLFELAHTGTIFLDEIGDSSLQVQTRLLRVLEEKEIMRLGDTSVIPLNIRVIAATNKDLKELVDEGKFRRDLYYRINVFRLHIPPLREREDSIPNLANIILKNYNPNKQFSKEALKHLINYNWEGNVREFKNMVEYSSQISKTNIIMPEDLPYDIKSYRQQIDEFGYTEYEKIYFQIQALFDIEQVTIVLEALKSNINNTKKIGRAPMLSILKKYNASISDRSLRTMLSHLENYELIIVGKTKQGTWLSNKGEVFLDYINTNTNN